MGKKNLEKVFITVLVKSNKSRRLIILKREPFPEKVVAKHMSNSSTMTDEQKLTSFKWMGFYKHPYLKHCVVHINETLHDLKVAILYEFLQYHAEYSNKSWKKKRLLDGISLHMLKFQRILHSMVKQKLYTMNFLSYVGVWNKGNSESNQLRTGLTWQQMLLEAIHVHSIVNHICLICLL